jgi:hypothetical protein
MLRFPLDERAQFGAQCLVGHEVDGAAEEVFEVELDAEIALGRGWTVEGNEHVDVAIGSSLAPRSRAEQRNVDYAETPHQLWLVLAQERKGALPIHIHLAA